MNNDEQQPPSPEESAGQPGEPGGPVVGQPVIVTAAPPTGKSTTKWSFTYESSTDAGYLAVQSRSGSDFANALPGVLKSVMEGLQFDRKSGWGQQSSGPMPPPLGPLGGDEQMQDEEDNVVEFPGARPWYSPAFARRLEQIDGEFERLMAMVQEFVVRFDRSFERGQCTSRDLLPMITGFFQAYESRPGQDYISLIQPHLMGLSATRRVELIKSWLIPLGASGELIGAALSLVADLPPGPPDEEDVQSEDDESNE